MMVFKNKYNNNFFFFIKKKETTCLQENLASLDLPYFEYNASQFPSMVGYFANVLLRMWRTALGNCQTGRFVYNFYSFLFAFFFQYLLLTFYFLLLRRESDVPNVESNVMKNARICSMQTVFNVSFFPNICYTYLLYFYFWCKNSNPKIVFNYNEMVILFFFVRKFKLEGFAVLV